MLFFFFLVLFLGSMLPVFCSIIIFNLVLSQVTLLLKINTMSGMLLLEIVLLTVFRFPSAVRLISQQMRMLISYIQK